MNNKVVAVIVAVVIVIALVPVAAKKMGNSGESPAPAANSDAGSDNELIAVGREVAEALTQGNFDAAAAKFDPKMKAAMSAQMWNQAWSGAEAKLGAFQKITGERVSQVQGNDVVLVTCQFERGKADLQIALNASRQVSGIYIR